MTVYTSNLVVAMPVRPTPMHYTCPTCGWRKTVAPRSDVLSPGDIYSACPVCDRADLQIRPAGTLQSEMAQMLDTLGQLLKPRR